MKERQKNPKTNINISHSIHTRKSRRWWWGGAHHIRGQLVTRQVLDILVVRVDDLRELAPVHHLLKHPHVDGGDEPVVFGRVGSHNLGNGRAPVEGRGTDQGSCLCCGNLLL